MEAKMGDNRLSVGVSEQRQTKAGDSEPIPIEKLLTEEDQELYPDFHGQIKSVNQRLEEFQ